MVDGANTTDKVVSCIALQMAVALGGRIAEELIFGENDITTGASNDFQQVSRTARLMVSQLGFSRKLGQVAWSQAGGNSFLGSSMAQPSDFSMETADAIDGEVKELVERAYRSGWTGLCRPLATQVAGQLAVISYCWQLMQV
eukprot:GHRR01016370.1.p1 GENE.GHRR01016370.1~~GHRR01016370.1.p1  ORF type:complete len:142 (-),score=48.83 GHRR01016370.1:720-1145(-)